MSAAERTTTTNHAQAATNSDAGDAKTTHREIDTMREIGNALMMAIAAAAVIGITAAIINAITAPIHL